MGDQGFTIKGQLGKLGVQLNIPPFLDSRTQLPPDDIKRTFNCIFADIGGVCHQQNQKLCNFKG